MVLRKNIEAVLIDGLEQLIKEGSTREYWCSNRATSDAIIALNTCLPIGEFSHLRMGALEYLLAESDLTDDKKRHWMEEIWDTSIASIAIATEPVRFNQEILESKNWLCSKYLHSHSSWNDELWETLCAINSLSFLFKTLPAKAQEGCDFSGSVTWLMQMVNTPRPGLLINWSSTALFVLFGSSPSLPGLTQDHKAQIQSYAKICAKTLLSAPITNSPDLLWTPEAWSNGLVLWAIAIAKKGQLEEEAALKAIQWFHERFAQTDLPTEDRAFACIGLYKYLEYLLLEEIKLATLSVKDNFNIEVLIEEAKDRLKRRIAINLSKRVQDFKPNPPFLSTLHHRGYYSINLHQKTTNVFLIVLCTILLSYLTWQSNSADSKFAKWMILIPIVLGALATIAQLANFTLFSKKNGFEKDKIE